MLAGKYFKIIASSVVVLLACPGIGFCVDDGFVVGKKIPGKHFTVFYERDVDTSILIQQLNIGPSDKLLAGKLAETKPSPDEELTDLLDTLFIRVCDTLDMPLYSFEGNIKVCRDEERLNQIYFNVFGHNLNNLHSFYIYELNTVYISEENFKSTTLGHEIAHAVISHYFVVLPSVKVQEVLAGYVEYQLRKETGAN